MENWTTVISFTYPQDAYLAKGKLESEGIEVILKDELTTQVNNFYSNAIGGVKLLIKETDVETATLILVEGGFLNQDPIPPSKFVLGFDEFSSKLPLIGNAILELRLMVVVTFVILILLGFFAIFQFGENPTVSEKLTQNIWCIDRVYANGKEVKVFSKQLRLKGEIDNCFETMNFRKNGIVIFPPVDTFDNWLHWETKNDSLIISLPNPDDLPLLGNGKNLKVHASKNGYIGRYSIQIENDHIELNSTDVVIKGKKRNINLAF